MVTSRALVACLLVASTVAACQGNGKGSAEGSGSAVGSGSASAHLVDARGPADAALPPEDADRRRVDEPEPTPDPSKLIADLNAVPAWQAVIDRAALLGRRGQRGVVYGRLGSAVMIPAPPPPPPPPPPPVIVPPTEAELKLMAEKAARDAMLSTRPQSLRYIGFLKSKTSGLIGAFFKGEEPFTFQLGHIENTNWKLVKLTDTQAEFQNSKYTDMKMVLEVRDYAGSMNPGAAATNEF